MLQIPCYQITEQDGRFTFVGPGGMSQIMSADAIDQDARALLADAQLAIRIARANWWLNRPADPELQAAHDAAHCRVIQWNPAQDQAVTYGA